MEGNGNHSRCGPPSLPRAEAMVTKVVRGIGEGRLEKKISSHTMNLLLEKRGRLLSSTELFYSSKSTWGLFDAVTQFP